MRAVFLGSEAVAQGKLSEYALRRWHRPVFRDVYVPKGHELTLLDRIEGAWLRSRRNGVVAGIAASALHGARWVYLDVSIELIWRNTRPPPGLVARDDAMQDDEVTRVAALPVTTVARTAYDLARRLPRSQALAHLDALMHATPFSNADVMLLAKRYHGARGLRRLRAVLPVVDGGAASPTETWLRLVPIDAGLPIPATQIPVVDGYWPVAFLDLGWKQCKVGVEYDGDHHRSDRRQYVKDQRRLRQLERLGWLVVRVIAEDKPYDIVRRVRAALDQRKLLSA